LPILLAVFLIMWLTPFDAFAQVSLTERLLALSREANSECTRAQLPEPALSAACQSAKAYDQALAERGFCLENGEWRGCTQAGPPAGPLAGQAEPPLAAEPEMPMRPAPQEPFAQVPPHEQDAQGPPVQDETYDLPGAENAEPGVEYGDWRSYLNPQFGTEADIPPGFAPKTQIGEGEGQTFTAGDDGSEVAVYGALIEGQSFAQYRDWYRTELAGISYEAGGRNWFVMSGIDAGKIYYVKVVRSERCGVQITHHMVLRYPAEQKERFDPLVERAANSLHGTTPDRYCSG
jgi:hypothetical protein